MNIATWATIGAIFVYSNSFTETFTAPKLLVLSLGLFLIAICKEIRTGPVFWAGILFIVVNLLSTIFGVDHYLGIVGKYNNYGLGILGLTIALLYHSASGDISILPLAGSILGLLTLSQYFGICPLKGIEFSDLTGNRAYSTLGSPTNCGLILAMILPLSGSLVYSLAIILGLLATGSRGALMAAGIGTLIARYSND